MSNGGFGLGDFLQRRICNPSGARQVDVDTSSPLGSVRCTQSSVVSQMQLPHNNFIDVHGHVIRSDPVPRGMCEVLYDMGLTRCDLWWIDTIESTRNSSTSVSSFGPPHAMHVKTPIHVWSPFCAHSKCGGEWNTRDDILFTVIVGPAHDLNILSIGRILYV